MSIRKQAHPRRLSVRPLTAADAPAFVGMVQSSANRFKEAGLASLPETADAFGRFIESNDGAPTRPGESRVVFGIFVPHDDGAAREPARLVGFIGIQTLHRFQGAGVWYGLEKSSCGSGLAKTAALLSMADFADRLKRAGQRLPARWVAHIKASNSQSQALAQSLGFERDELLDYTRSTSSRGGTRFQGFWMERSAQSLAAEASRRVAAAGGLAVLDEAAFYATRPATPQPHTQPPARRRARP